MAPAIQVIAGDSVEVKMINLPVKPVLMQAPPPSSLPLTVEEVVEDISTMSAGEQEETNESEPTKKPSQVYFNDLLL